MKNYYIAGAVLIAFAGLTFAPLQANAEVSHPRVHEVNRRLENQQDRIQQGVKSGELTRREAENVRLQDARIRYQEQRDRITHEGHLTRQEDKQLNKELNRDSRTIYRDKHNDRIR